MHLPELSFFKSYLESMHATIPAAKADEEKPKEEHPHEHAHEHAQEPAHQHAHDHAHEHEHGHEEHEEEEMHVDDPLLMTPDHDFESVQMGDASKEVTEDEDGDSFSLMAQGRKLARDGKHEEAVKKLTEAILMNPKGSALFATRAESFFELKRPNAAIHDANRALELNPDSGKALKIRGKARRFLGKYAEAFYDLQQGNLLDFDEQTDKIIKDIKERAEAAIHKQRKEEEKKRIENLKREAAEKRRKQQEEEDARNREESGFPGGGFGGMPGMEGMGGIFDALMKDPEIKAALGSDPKATEKLMAFMSSGGSQYANDPTVLKVMAVLSKKMPGMGGMGGAGAGAGAGGHGHAHGPGGHGHSHGAGGHSHKMDDDLD
uniref:Hsp70-interacting protein N-terminal domain-containing protein n=1 Tax=Arcella intermedia TaxID=1963864 RepID=A0A6B2L6Q3_9EUKA